MFKSNYDFPDVTTASEEGIVCQGADLNPDTLLHAYSLGMFPWFDEKEDPILWWCPDPRCIIFPSKIKISKSMRSVLRNKGFEVRYNTCFADLIEACKSAPRIGQGGSWLSKEMKSAYIAIHELGYANSVEVFLNNELVGGLYGISIGKCFFGESMFSKVANASKVALVHLSHTLAKEGFNFVDCQMYTDHLQRMGAEMITRNKFLSLLKDGINFDKNYNLQQTLKNHETI